MDDTPNDRARHGAPVRDTPRQPTSLDPAHFTMTVDDASARFADAGMPRSVRSIQRYCQRGHLSCTTVDTEISEMYLIDQPLQTQVQRDPQEEGLNSCFQYTENKISTGLKLVFSRLKRTLIIRR